MSYPRPIRLIAMALVAVAAGCAGRQPPAVGSPGFDLRPQLVLSQQDPQPSLVTRFLRLVRLESEPPAAVAPLLLDPEEMILRTARREGVERVVTTGRRTAASGTYLGSEETPDGSGIYTAGIPLPISGSWIVEFGTQVPVERSFAVPYAPREYQLMLGIRVRF